MINNISISAKNGIRSNSYVHYLLILIVCGFAFFVNNDVIPADLMESRNLATTQEMVREGNYLVPTMNGELRLEKPPLPTWVAAGVEHVLPSNLIAQRSVAGLIATMMVIFLFLLIKEITNEPILSFVSGLVLATSFNIILMGRTATWDIYCHSFMLGAIYFLSLALKHDGAQWHCFILAGLFMGFSFLSKGPVSFFTLLLPFFIGYGITYRPRLKGKIAPLAAMILLCLIISFWWTLYLLVTHPDMMLSVANKESSSWLNHNIRPWYYYWQFPAEAGIWALFLVSSILYFLYQKRYKVKDIYTFAFIWFTSSLVLLSVIPEKKTRYLLPILIPGAILVGAYFCHSIKNVASKFVKVLFKINATVIAIVLFAIPVILYLMLYSNGKMSIAILLISVLFFTLLGIYILRSNYRREGIKIYQFFFAIILSMILVETICLDAIGSIFINTHRKSIIELRNNEIVKHLPFYYNQKEPLRMELVYEANQIIRKIDISNDSLIYQNMPFVFVSGQHIDSAFIGKDVTIEHIGTFDNNWRQPDNKRYNPDLVRNVAILRYGK